MLPKRPEALGIISRYPGKRLFPQLGIERLAMVALQLGLVVPSIHVTEPAGTENLNHRLRFCRIVTGLRRKRIVRRRRQSDRGRRNLGLGDRRSLARSRERPTSQQTGQ